MKSRPAILRLIGLGMAMVLLGTSEAGGFPHCWGTPSTVATSSQAMGSLKARVDSEGTVHLLWHDSAASTICHVSRDASGTWSDVEHVIGSCNDVDFAIALDASDGLHLVWKVDAGFGAPGQTSHLYYKTKPKCEDWGDSVCITSTFNDPDSLETIGVEEFENGVPPVNWGRDSDNTNQCYDRFVDTLWGTWEMGDSSCSGAHCAEARRFYGCGSLHCALLTCQCYLVMPPLLAETGDLLKFRYRVSAPGQTATLAVKAFYDFALGSTNSFAGPGGHTLWEGITLANTAYQTATVSLNSLAGQIGFVAFELSATSSTSAAVYIDCVFDSVDAGNRPEVAHSAADCFSPSMTVDADGDVHVAFGRIVWQPEGCFCGGQQYYVRRDATSGTWGVPAHVPGSGIGGRNYAKITNTYYRGTGESDIAADGSGDVHVVWRDVGMMNFVSGGDDILYSCRPSTSPDWGWQSFPDTLSDDGEGAAVDTSYCLAPAVAVDGSDNVIAVFHGTRPDSSRFLPSTPMLIWWRQKTGSGWSSSCMPVADPAVDYEILNCRTPSLGLDSAGNMFVAYTWQDTVAGPLPWGSAFATFVGDDEEWVQPARVITHLEDNLSVVRPICLQMDESGDAHLAWIEDDRTSPYDSTAYRWRVMYMKSLGWTTCVDSPHVEVDEFIRCLCPEGDIGHGNAAPSEAIVTALDTSQTTPIPLPEIPAGELYLTFSGDMQAPPPDTCFDMDDIAVGPRWGFWCTPDSSKLLSTEPTDSDGRTLIEHAKASGRARLRVQAHAGDAHSGFADTVWINSFDQNNPTATGVDGHVTGTELLMFIDAYEAWADYHLENWAWDFVSNAACGPRPVFSVTVQDFGEFATHYADEYDCGKKGEASAGVGAPTPSGPPGFTLSLDGVTVGADTVTYAVGIAASVESRVLDLRFDIPEGLELLSWQDGDFFNDPLRIGPYQFTDGQRVLVALAARGPEPVFSYSGIVGTLLFARTGGEDTAPSIVDAVLIDESREEYDLVSEDTPVRPSSPMQVTFLVPRQLALRRVTPNPVSTHTTVEFEVPRPGSDVRIRIYDVQGRVVRTLTDGHRAAGYYSEVWDLTNAAGQHVAPGVYFCRMEAGSFRDTRKVVLLQ